MPTTLICSCTLFTSYDNRLNRTIREGLSSKNGYEIYERLPVPIVNNDGKPAFKRNVTRIPGNYEKKKNNKKMHKSR